MASEEKNVSAKAIVPEDKQGLVSRSPALISRGLHDLTGSLDSIIVEMAKALHGEDCSPEELIAEMVEKANEVLRSETHSLFLTNGKDDLWSFDRQWFKPMHIKIREGIAVWHLPPNPTDDTPIKRTGAGLAGWVARTGEVVVVPDTSKDSRFVMEVDGKGTTEVHSIVAAPVIHGDRCLGVVELVNCIGAEGFSKRKLVLLKALTDLAAIAIENAHYMKTLWHLGINNRSYLDILLDSLIDFSQRSEWGFSLIGIDLNLDGIGRTILSETGRSAWPGFRESDDEPVPFGAWECCVKQLGKALKESCGRSDDVFRCSDTRFAILVQEHGETRERARRTACDLDRKFSKAEWLTGYARWMTVKLPVCVGVVSFPKDASNKDQLLQILEDTLSLVRRSGRGGIATADEGILRRDDEM